MAENSNTCSRLTNRDRKRGEGGGNCGRLGDQFYQVTYIRVKGKWVYLYRAVDSSVTTIDFLLSAKRDAAAAERFLAKALGGENQPAPRVIKTDEHAGYTPAIGQLKAKVALEENCRPTYKKESIRKQPLHPP